jgi:ABC-type transporter Mla subunit MlaD
MIRDGLTQGTKVVGHALHQAAVVADAEVALLEDAEPGIELQNTRLMIAEELSLEREPRLMCVLHQFPHDLVKFGGEGAEDLCHHDVVQSSPIDGWIGDVGDDVVVEGVAMKHEKDEVASPLVVG